MGEWSLLTGGSWPANISTANCNVMTRDNGKEFVIINRATQGFNSWYEVYSFFTENETWFKWNMTGQAPSASYTSNIAFTSSPDGNVGYQFGGTSQWSGTSDKLNVFFYSNKTWVQYTAPSTLGDRYGSGMTYDGATDTVWIFGGRDNDRVRYNDLHTFSLSSGWGHPTPPDPKPQTRDQSLMTISPDGKFLYVAIGRYQSGGGGSLWCNDVWEFNVTGNSWRVLNSTLGIPTDTNAIFQYRAAGGDLILSMGLDGMNGLNNTYIIDDKTGNTIRVYLTGGIPARSLKGWDLMEDGRTVVVLGDTSGTKDIWELDIYTYASLLGPGNPIWAGGSAFTGYDPENGGKLMALKYISGSYWQLVYFSISDGDWHNLTVSDQNTPTYRSGMASAYDPVANDFYLYGGYYRYQVSQWTYHFYFYDEFWKLDTDTGAWTRIAQHAFPSGKGNANMVFDPVGNMLYLFGGQIPGGDTNELFEYDISGDSWSEITSTIQPTERMQTTLCMYPEKNGFYLFGGNNNGTTGQEDDLWFFHTDTKKWEQMTGATNPPQARYSAGLSVNSATDEVIVFGGSSDIDPDVFMYRPSWRSWEKDTPRNKPYDWSGHGQVYSPVTGLHYIWAGESTEVWEYKPVLRTTVVKIDLLGSDGKAVKNAFPTISGGKLLVQGITDMPQSDITGLDITFDIGSDTHRYIWTKLGNSHTTEGNSTWFTYPSPPDFTFITSKRWEFSLPMEFGFGMPHGTKVDVTVDPLTNEAHPEGLTYIDAFTMISDLQVVNYNFHTPLQSMLSTGEWLFGRTTLTVDGFKVTFADASDVFPTYGDFKVVFTSSRGETGEWDYSPGALGNISLPITGNDREWLTYHLNLTDDEDVVLDSRQFQFRLDLDPPTAPEWVKVRVKSFTDEFTTFDNDNTVYLTWGPIVENGSGLKGVFYSMDADLYPLPLQDNQTYSFKELKFVQEGFHTIYLWTIDNTSRASPKATVSFIEDNHQVVFSKLDPDPSNLMNTTWGRKTFKVTMTDPLSGVDLQNIYYRQSLPDRSLGPWERIEMEGVNASRVDVSVTLDLIPGIKNLIQFKASDMARTIPRESVYFQVYYDPSMGTPQVSLLEPSDGLVVKGQVKLAWKGTFIYPANLSYELHIIDPKGADHVYPIMASLYSFKPVIPGLHRWYVTGIADGLTNKSSERAFSFDPARTTVIMPALTEVTIGREVAVRVELTNNLEVPVNLTFSLEQAKGFSIRSGSEVLLQAKEKMEPYLVLNSSGATEGSYNLVVKVSDDYGRSALYNLSMKVSKEKINQDDDDEEEEGPSMLLLLAIAAVVLVVIVVIVILVLRKRGREEEEPEEAEEEERPSTHYDPKGKVAKGGSSVTSAVPLTPGLSSREEEHRMRGSNVMEITYHKKDEKVKATPEYKGMDAWTSKTEGEVEEISEIEEIEEPEPGSLEIDCKCGSTIKIKSAKRPYAFTCQECGRKGVLKEEKTDEE